MRRSAGRAAIATATAALVVGALALPAYPAQQHDSSRGAGSPAADSPASDSVDNPVETTLEQTKVPVVHQAAKRARDLAEHGVRKGLSVVAELGETRTKDFGVVGLTWEKGFSGDDITAQVRVRADGSWTGWQDLEIEEGSDTGKRGGTAPIWVGPSDGVAARVLSSSGEKPQHLRVVTIDGGEGFAEPSAAESASAAPQAPGATRVRPAMASAAASSGVKQITHPAWVTRKQWGVDRSTEISCSAPRTAPRTRGIVLHHTAGSNSYSRAQAPGIVRAIHAYHTDGRGWCDIGYNYLVDKYGRIYIGRRGGAKKQVRGAHAGNFDVNLRTTGISMIGNFDSARPSRALKNAVTRLTTWKLAYYYRHARGKLSFDGGKIKRISGHRDVYNSGIRPATSTACPGRYGYRWLNANGGLRDRVDKNLDQPYIAGRVLHKYRHHRRQLKTPEAGIHKVRRHKAWVARFANGKIYAHHHRTYVVWGTVSRKYRKVGGPNGHLGLPKNDTHKVRKRKAWVSRFGNGKIYSHHGAGHMLWGTVSRKYRKSGGPRGRLGLPTNDTHKVRKMKVWASRFGKGHIYSHNGRGFASYGRIDDRYQKVGGPRGKLGPTTTDIRKVRYGQRARYRHGFISYNTDTGRVRVHYR